MKNKILIASDTYHPEVNGVVNHIINIGIELEKMGYQVSYIHPGYFITIPTPRYKSVRLAVNAWPKTKKLINERQPNFVHIATEGPIGIATRQHCIQNNLPFTTSYLTQFDRYISLYFPWFPQYIVRSYVKWFHKKSNHILAPTQSIKHQLLADGFNKNKMITWGGGVDRTQFKPTKKTAWPYTKPIWIYAGRVSIEKNIEAFLKLELEGTKIIVGDGPQLSRLKKDFPEVIFKPCATQSQLASYFSSSDAFIFPSKTDTFGLVMIEALACGLPVAAYHAPGATDIFQGSKINCLHHDLKVAAIKALNIKKDDCIEHAKQFDWAKCAKILITLYKKYNQYT